MTKAFAKRSQRGSLVTWLLMLAAIGLMIVVGTISLELGIRWISLSRVQNAANEAALVYARDIIRLRDNSLSALNADNLTFQNSGVPHSCDNQASGGIGSCTPLSGDKASIPGATSLEYLNASQTLLYNIWGARISDPSEVTDVQQFQCYEPYEGQRFSKIESPPPTCTTTGNVTSPITDLAWSFTVNPYGNGVCCPATGDNANKDYCVDVRVTGRMDPIMAGGLPFLSGRGIFEGKQEGKPIAFITIGSFEVHARAVADTMAAIGVAADNDNIAGNLSGETVRLENIPSNSTCAPAPPVIAPQRNPLATPTIRGFSIPEIGPLPTSTWEPYEREPISQKRTPQILCQSPYTHCETLSLNESSAAFVCCKEEVEEKPEENNECPPGDPSCMICNPGEEIVYTPKGLTMLSTVGQQNLSKGSDYLCQPPSNDDDGASSGDCKCPDKVLNSVKKNNKACPRGLKIVRKYYKCPNGGRSRTKCVRELACREPPDDPPRRPSETPSPNIPSSGVSSCTPIEASDCQNINLAVGISTVFNLARPFTNENSITIHAVNIHSLGMSHVANSRVTTNTPMIRCKEDINDFARSGVKAYCAKPCGCNCEKGSGDCNTSFGYNSPLVISLNKTKPKVSNKTVNFAFDGVNETKTYWLANGKDVGFIFLDLNGDGLASGNELFGPHFEGAKGDISIYMKNDLDAKKMGIKKSKSLHRDGFSALIALKDKNQNGVISGSELNDLKVWFDKNNNASPEDGETINLQELGVSEIFVGDNLKYPKKWINEKAFLSPYTEKGYSLKNRQTGAVYDIWFKEKK